MIASLLPRMRRSARCQRLHPVVLSDGAGSAANGTAANRERQGLYFSLWTGCAINIGPRSRDDTAKSGGSESAEASSVAR